MINKSNKKLLTDFNLICLNQFISEINILLHYFSDNIALLLGALINFINRESKVLKSTGVEVKTSLITKIKVPLLNLLNENIENLEKFSGLDKLIHFFPKLDSENQMDILNVIIQNEMTKIIKNLKDISRKKRDFIKNLI